MAQNFNNSHGAPHGSPPFRQPNGYEDLMGSLKSPGLAGPAAPFQPPGFAPPQWPMMNWQQNPSQGNFAYSMPSQMSPVNQMSWTQNGQEGYVPFPQEEDDDELFTVDDTELVGQNGQQHSIQNVGTSGNMQIPQSRQQVQPGQLASLSSSTPLTLPPPQVQAGMAPGPPPVPVSPKTNNAATTARAAELRAKLLASRGPKAASRQASPAFKSNEISDTNKAELMNTTKQANGKPQSEIAHQAASAASTHTLTGNKPSLHPLITSPTNTATSLNGAIDTLMADARSAVDAPKQEAPLTNGKHARLQSNGNSAQATNIVKQTGGMTMEPTLAMSRIRSASELSEPGEIRSGAATPTPAEQPESSTISDSSRAMQDNQDKEEKLARQNEVNKAYQPLKKPKAHKPEQKGSQAKASPPPKQMPAQPQKQNRKASLEKRVGDYERPPIPEESRREEHRERAKDYDRRDEYRDSRRTSISEAYPSTYDLERDVAARRQKLTEDNARRAAEYKRELGAQRARQSALDKSKSSKEKQTRENESKRQLQSAAADADRKGSIMSEALTNTGMQTNDSGDGRQGVDTVMLSPRAQTVEGNEDVNDWLELTEFYDEEYREKRLELFRKKKALDIQREEIEREEHMQLQERTMRSRAPSIIPTATSSPATRRPSTVNVRMPPPPLPLRQANNDPGIKIKNSALSASLPASQTSSPTLKRQHAEDDTETSRTQSMDKRARVDVHGLPPDERPLTSPASARGERASVKGEPVPLESRISRYDDWPPPRGRPRSRSPDFRRRSLSPRRRRYSQDYSPGPPPGRFRDYSAGPRRPNDPRTCFNCGQQGHYHGQCPEPRRDGRDWQQAPRRYEQYKPPTYISPNYLGKNPQANPPKSRVNSVSKIEEV